MSKRERIDTKAAVSWQDTGADGAGDGLALATRIMNVMEQGIIVWSADGVCELHNTRVFEVLELERNALYIGADRDRFLEASFKRNEFPVEVLTENKRRFEAKVPFQFDRTLPSGRIVSTSARPTREGAFVVTSTDVTEARKAAEELAQAKQAAEAAEAQAREILQEERARRAEARTLSDLDEWLQSCKSLDELFKIVAKFMGALVPNSEGELYLYSNSRDVLDGACEWGKGAPINDHITPDSCWSLRRGRAYEHNPHALCFTCDHVQTDESTPPGNYICIPVIAHGDTVGLLHIRFSDKTPHSEVKSMGRFASRCAEHISMAIANVKLRDELHDQSIRDPLTGLFNRRYFMDAMRREVTASDQGGKGFGLISFDADKFKMFNDNHGHDAGDLVLRTLSDRMLAVMPDDCVCARVGGEEFAVLVPQSNLTETVEVAEALRADLAAMEVRTAYGTLPPVTISAGVAAYVGDNTPPSVLMKRADEALYVAKSKGRNRVDHEPN